MSVLYTQDPPLCLQRYISFIPFFVLKGAWKTLKQKVVVFLDQIQERPTACQRTHTKVVTFANHSRSGEKPFYDLINLDRRERWFGEKCEIFAKIHFPMKFLKNNVLFLELVKIFLGEEWMLSSKGSLCQLNGMQEIYFCRQTFWKCEISAEKMLQISPEIENGEKMQHFHIISLKSFRYFT